MSEPDLFEIEGNKAVDRMFAQQIAEKRAELEAIEEAFLECRGWKRRPEAKGADIWSKVIDGNEVWSPRSEAVLLEQIALDKELKDDRNAEQNKETEAGGGPTVDDSP